MSASNASLGPSAGVGALLPGMLDALADAILVVDRDERVVFANHRYREIFGGPNPFGPVHCRDAARCPEHAHAGRCAACRARDERRVQHELHSITDGRGVTRRCEGTFSPLVNGAGQVTHVVEVWRDISERAALEGQLAHSERLASVGMLAAGVGHEINNPLASILAAVESLSRMMARGGDPRACREEALETLRMIEHDVVRCRETTDKLMLLAQPYRGTPAWVDVNRAVRDTAALLRHHMQKQGIGFEETLDPGLPAVWARDSGVRGVCMNLMMNAVQAMPDGGALRAETAVRDGAVEIAIEDTGPGIAAEHLHRIWEPFFTTKPPGQGTGLGLFVSQGVVTRYGGTITASNRADGGARFLVRLPLKHGSPS